jgi:hypothetical protein
MSNNPFGDVSDQNPYAASVSNSSSGDTGNPLLIPAIVLLVFSLLFVLLIVGTIPGHIIRFRMIDTSTPEGAGELTGGITALVLWPLFTLCITFGSISMIRMKGYSSATFAAILAVIPICSPCIVIGIPFGVWALIVLRRPEVKRRFT